MVSRDPGERRVDGVQLRPHPNVTEDRAPGRAGVSGTNGLWQRRKLAGKGWDNRSSSGVSSGDILHVAMK